MIMTTEHELRTTILPLNTSHYKELTQVEIPCNFDQCIDYHRAEVHQDPAVLEELEPVDNDEVETRE